MRLPSKRGLLSVLGATTLSGCSLIYDLSPDQCGSTADCESFGENYVCEEGMCKFFEPPGECEESADCLEEAQNTPRACIEQERGKKSSRVCVPLRTQECPYILPIAANPAGELWREMLRVQNSVVIGAYGFLQQGPDSPDIRNYDLALTELNEQGGIPGPEGAGARPVIAVVCDTAYDDSDELYAGVDHLVKDLRVPGVIASLLSDQLQLAFNRAQSIEENPNVFFMSPVDNDETIAGLNDNNLVWNILPNGTEISGIYGPLFDRSLAYLESSQRVPAGETIRVAVLVARDIRVVADIGANLRNLIRFNDKSYQENDADGNLVRVDIVSSYDESFATYDYTAAIDRVMDLKPHVIFALGADETFTRIIPQVEMRWPTEVPDQERPFYLFSPYSYNSPSGAQTMLAHGTPDRLSQRVAGVNWATVIPEYRYVLDDYLLRMSYLYSDREPDLGWENWYDASWYFLYSLGAGAAKSKNFLFDGLQLASGMQRLLRGPEVTVDPATFTGTMQQLAVSNSSVTLVGTMGLPTFDSTGAREGEGSVYCFTPAGMQPADVLRVDENGELVADKGDIDTCIPGF
jgi:hypothetical protein